MADENKAMIRRGISTVAEVETAINEKAREKYVDAQDAATLDTAKNYADEREAMIRTDFEQGDADVLTEAAKALAEAIAVLKGGASVDYDTFKKLQTKIETINEAISGTATPDTIDTLNEALAFIREHQGEIESLVNTYVRKEAIANDLTTDDPTRILSAAQGVALKALIDAVALSLDGYVEKVNGAGLMTDEEREKLSGIEERANAYELPTASGSVLGGVKVGAGLEIDEDGTLSAPGGSGGGGYVLPKASAETLGGIKVGNNLSIREDGTLDAQAGSGGAGTEKLVLPYIEPVYGDDGGLTNKEAFIEAWGPVMKKYRAAPDSYRLFMEMPSGIGTEMAEVPCQTVMTQDMGEEGQALLLSAYGAACIPGGPGAAVPLGVFAGATIMFDASGEIMSVEYPAYAPAMTDTGMPNMVLQKVYINVDDLSKEGKELKNAVQPYIDLLRGNPMAEAVMVDAKNGWVVPMVVTKWMGDSDLPGGSKYILQGNLHHIVENEDEKIGGVSSFVAVCDVDAAGKVVTASYSLRDSDWVAAEAMNAALAKKANAPATLQNADLNTLTSNGLYVADGSISNAPASTANCRVLVIATSPYRVTQIAQVYDADRLFFRRRIDEQWQPWRELWHAGNFNPDEKLTLQEGWNGDANTVDNLVSKPFGATNIPYGYHPFLSFGGGGYKAQLNALNNSLKFRSTNETGALREWVEIYHSGNLAPATASAAGLMSAEDRIKLNSVASALSLPVVTEDTPTTLKEANDDAAPAMAVTPQACIRAQRAAQYQMQTDELLYDALEAFARNHPEYSEFAAWLEAKDRIRQEFPKPEVTEAAGGPETDGEPQTGGTEPVAEQKGGEE